MVVRKNWRRCFYAYVPNVPNVYVHTMDISHNGANLRTATFHLYSRYANGIVADYLWFSVPIPYVRWSIPPYEETRNGGRRSSRFMGSVRVHHRGGNDTVRRMSCIVLALIYRRECDTIPRVSNTMEHECEIGGISQWFRSPLRPFRP